MDHMVDDAAMRASVSGFHGFSIVPDVIYIYTYMQYAE